MNTEKFLNKQRKDWMARTFQGLFLLTAAGAMGESFLKLSVQWRVGILGIGFGAFAAGLVFAKENAVKKEES